MPRKTRREKARFYIAVVGALLIGCIVSVYYGYHLRAVWLGSFAVAAACWIVAALFPVRCAVPTRLGSSCRNTANGVLFGCSRSGHTWIKFRAHFGRHERVRVRSATTAPSAEPRTAEAAESRRSTVLFWLAFVATGAGVISMTTDVIGLFD